MTYKVKRKKPKEKSFRVEVIDFKTGKVDRVIGRGLSERKADNIEMGLLRQMDRENFGVRVIKE
jgi:hypothetical protein